MGNEVQTARHMRRNILSGSNYGRPGGGAELCSHFGSNRHRKLGWKFDSARTRRFFCRGKAASLCLHSFSQAKNVNISSKELVNQLNAPIDDLVPHVAVAIDEVPSVVHQVALDLGQPISTFVSLRDAAIAKRKETDGSLKTELEAKKVEKRKLEDDIDKQRKRLKREEREWNVRLKVGELERREKEENERMARKEEEGYERGLRMTLEGYGWTCVSANTNSLTLQNGMDHRHIWVGMQGICYENIDVECVVILTPW